MVINILRCFVFMSLLMQFLTIVTVLDFLFANKGNPIFVLATLYWSAVGLQKALNEFYNLGKNC